MLLALVLGGASEAGPVKIPIPAVSPEPVFDGGFAPKALPMRAAAPITVRVSAKVPTPPGHVHPARLRKVTIVGDRAVSIAVADLPACSATKLRTLSPAAAKALCGPSIVGRGTAVAGAVFPGERLITEKAGILAFNGGRRAGVTTILLYAQLTIPTRTAIVAVARVRRVERGRYGLEAVVSIPQFGNDFGQVTAFDLTFDRGAFRARCPDGRLQGRALADFDDAETVETIILSTCKARS